MEAETTVLDTDGEAPVRRSLERVCEAMIFAADEPLAPARIAAVYAEVTGEPRPPVSAIEEAVDRLNAAYEATERTFRIHRWAGGYRMATEPELAPYVRALFEDTRQRRLSRSLMETLAVVAYRQPVTKPEVDYVRGVDSDYALRRLLELNLIDVVGRSEAVGRPLLYGTTARFLEQFGLQSLGELPNLREVEELLNDPAFNRERARLLMEAGLHEGAPEPLAQPPDASPDETSDP
ncbi:MAG: SMC-Scp complex subunit ScpB [Bacteroidetes bacterium]|nr:MAG: SMC-Scp complex subunit ScpB [Bacteroidota bacterium]